MNSLQELTPTLAAPLAGLWFCAAANTEPEGKWLMVVVAKSVIAVGWAKSSVPHSIATKSPSAGYPNRRSRSGLNCALAPPSSPLGREKHNDRAGWIFERRKTVRW